MPLILLTLEKDIAIIRVSKKQRKRVFSSIITQQTIDRGRNYILNPSTNEPFKIYAPQSYLEAVIAQFDIVRIDSPQPSSTSSNFIFQSTLTLLIKRSQSAALARSLFRVLQSL